MGFPWEWKRKADFRGNGNGNDFRGSGNVEKCFVKKFPLISNLKLNKENYGTDEWFDQFSIFDTNENNGYWITY